MNRSNTVDRLAGVERRQRDMYGLMCAMFGGSLPPANDRSKIQTRLREFIGMDGSHPVEKKAIGRRPKGRDDDNDADVFGEGCTQTYGL